MTKKDYLHSSSLAQSLAENSFSSEEDFVDLQEFPRMPRNNSSVQLVSTRQCARTRSCTGAMPQNKSQERQIISSYVASNLRRCQSSVSYQKKKSGFRDPEKTNPAITVRSSSSRRPSKFSEGSVSSNEYKKEDESKGLCRKSSFDFIQPESQITSPVESYQLQDYSRKEQKERNWENTESQKIAPARKFIRDKSHGVKPTAINMPRVNLRDSAIDLVSDEEDSEAYTAVSLAGTLGRNNFKPNKGFTILRKQNRKFYVVIGVLCGIILVLGGLAVTLALILFR